MHSCFGINEIGRDCMLHIKFYKEKLLTFLMVVAKLDSTIGGSEPKENTTACGVGQ